MEHAGVMSTPLAANQVVESYIVPTGKLTVYIGLDSLILCHI